MTIDLFSKGKLLSKVVRENIAGVDGIREIGTIDEIGESSSTSPQGGLIGGLNTAAGILSGIFKGFKGFFFGALQKAFQITLSFSSIFSYLVQGTIFLLNFDWNASDEEIDKQLQSSFTSWAAQVGGSLGGALGYFACGVAPTAAMFAFNPAMAAYVLAKTGPEALEEMQGYLVNIIRSSFRLASQFVFSQTYKTIRSLIKIGFSGIIPGIDRWGAKNGARFTISGQVEKGIESIKNPALQAFTESFFEELGEGCVEGGFALTGAMDAFVYEQKIRENAQISELLEIKPNRESSEVVLLAGSREQLKPAITQVMAQHQLIKNRDLGEVNAVPLEAYVQRASQLQPNNFNLHLKLTSSKQPPFKWRDDDFQQVTIVIPDVPLSNLNWEKIKKAIGPNGWTYGKYVATAKLSNGRQTQVYAATADMAKSKAKDLAELSVATIQTLNVSELTNEGKRKLEPNLQKKNLQVYPYQGKAVRVVRKTGTKDEMKSFRFNLWTQEEPIDFDINKQDLIK
jgi:hypothetical protein